MTATERNSALEEAAKVCDKEIERLQAYRHHGFWAVSDCAVLIRALKSAAPEDSDSETPDAWLECMNGQVVDAVLTPEPSGPYQYTPLYRAARKP